MHKFRNTARLIEFATRQLDELVYFAQHDESGFFEKVPRSIQWDPPLDLNGKRGGSFCVSTYTGLVISHSFIGDVPEEELVDCWEFATNKAARLTMFKDHLSSWQSRNNITKCGGAVRGEEFILSFSGLSELWDEAFMLVVAVQSDNMKLERADAIAVISSNPHWTQLRETYFV